MKFVDIYNQFTKSTKENFPILSCTGQNEREANVYDSDTPYICLVVDKRFDNYWNLIILYPYICKESEILTTYGWVDRYGNVYCNIENSTQLLDKFVVGFKKYTESERSYKQLWDGFIHKIEEQYED